MPVVTDPSAKAQYIKWRRTRSQFRQPISEMDPNTPRVPSIIQSTRCKSTISSLLSTFSNYTTNETRQGNLINGGHNKKKISFSTAAFRGFGCTAGASQQVSVPAVIRASADWQSKTRKRKNKRNFTKNKDSNKNFQGVLDNGPNPGSAHYVDFQDVWCGPGTGFSAGAGPSVDCVVARKNVSGRGKIDAKRTSHKELPSYLRRRTLNPEPIAFLDSDTDPDNSPIGLGSESIGTAGYYDHEFAEVMMLEGSLLMGGRLDSRDQFRDLRLDVDDMSYEELLELGERIGYVNTGLKDDEIGCQITKIKLPHSNDTSVSQVDKKCSICQEEYEGDDELGRLNCGHNHHIQCIRQWLAQKNFCPVCKAEVAKRH